MARLSEFVLALAMACPIAQAQDAETVARLQALHAEARYGDALDEVARLSDPVLAAEWRCFLALAAGDLPAALAAIRAGLALQPEHRGLLVNAVHVTLTLGLGAEALQRAETLTQALDRAGDAAPEERERAQRLLAAAQAQRAIELQSVRSLALARTLALSLLALSAAALLALALRPGRAEEVVARTQER